MATPSDEILLKLAVDLGDVKTEFQDLSKLTQDRINETNEAEKKLKSYGDTAVKEAERVNKAFQKNIDTIKGEVDVIKQAEKILESFYKAGTKAFDNKKIKEFGETVKKQFDSLQGLSKISFDFNEKDLDKLSTLLETTKNEYDSLLVVMTVMQDKLNEMDYKDENAQQLNDELEKLTPQVKALSMYLEETGHEFKNLNQELTVTKQAMAILEAEGKQNSDRYKELKDRAVQLQKAIKDVNQEIKHSASDTAGLESVISAVNGLVGIYATAQGAAALFGEESEDLNKTIQKLGGALAILNGLQATQAELANKQGIANKALTYVQGQYALATDASAKSTLRLRAAFNLLGIGLIVSALAAAVVYWKDIAKWMGIVSEESERNANITKRSNELYGEQIAQLTVLNKRVKEGGLSFKQKETAVKEFNDTFGKTLGSVKDYNELEERMIKNGDTYIQYVKLKAQAEATYQLAIESTMQAIQDRERVLNKDFTLYERFGLMLERGASNLKSSLGFSGERAGDLTNEDFEFLMGLPNEKDVEKFLSQYSLTNRAILEKYYDDNKNSDSLLNRQSDYLSALDELAKKAGDIIPDIEGKTKKATKATKDWTAEINKLVNELIRMQEAYAIGLIDNDRERETALRRQQFEEEMKGLQDQIDAIKVSNERKLQLQKEFNKLYNEENGLAYQAMVRDLEEIDRQYEEKAREAQLMALTAINEVNNLSAKNEIDAIKRKWDAIRKELRRQIQLTEDEGLKQELNELLFGTNEAEVNELNEKTIEQGLRRVEIEEQSGKLLLQIYQRTADKYLEIEDLKNLQILMKDRQMLEKRLAVYRATLSRLEQEEFDVALKILSDPAATKDQLDLAYASLILLFGEEQATRILGISNAIGELNEQIKGLNENLASTNISDWFKSTKAFATELGRTLGLEGKNLSEFADVISDSIESIWGTFSQMMDQKVIDHQNRVSAIEQMISQTESLLETERSLYENGYANNFELRKKELADLKKQKAEEAELLRKAQREQAAIQRAQIIAQSAMQVSNLATAATNIFKGTTQINPIVGVALGAALVASLIAAFMALKGTAEAAAAPSFRKGLEEGALTLDGASHERGGMGLYDSASGRKVAEYEGGEKLYALNKGQQSKYGWLMQMMIDDAKGRKPIMDSLIGRVPVTGKKTIRKVREVNEITRSAHKKRAEASNEHRELLNEIRDFKKSVNEELGGFKNRETEKTEYWEDPHFFYVKKNGVTKKYKKNPDE